MLPMINTKFLYFILDDICPINRKIIDEATIGNNGKAKNSNIK